MCLYGSRLVCGVESLCLLSSPPGASSSVLIQQVPKGANLTDGPISVHIVHYMALRLPISCGECCSGSKAGDVVEASFSWAHILACTWLRDIIPLVRDIYPVYHWGESPSWFQGEQWTELQGTGWLCQSFSHTHEYEDRTHISRSRRMRKCERYR
jgi:hypothetical protein